MVAAGAATVAAEKSGFEFDYSLHSLFQRKKLEKKNPFLICFGFLEIEIARLLISQNQKPKIRRDVN